MRLPESEERRRLELELFYHYCTEAGPSIVAENIARPFWIDAMCNAAIRSDAVMHCVCLLSTLHKAYRSGFTDLTYMTHVSRYLAAALHEHNKDVRSINASNVDFACLSSSALRVYRWVELQGRSLEPYNPPIDWLRLSIASRFLFTKAEELFKSSASETISSRMIANAKSIAVAHYSDMHSDVLAHILKREQPHELEEPWDDEIAETYSDTCKFVGGLWRDRNDLAAVSMMKRVLGLFPMLIMSRFIGLVEERRPRALVILAHYFAILSLRETSWFIGNAGAREAHAIAANLPVEWQELVREPMAIVVDRSERFGS